MAYEYEIPAVNGKPLVEIPKELKDKVIDYIVLRDKIIIKASDLVDQLLYDTRVKVRDELGRLVKSITEYSYPPFASAVVTKDEDYVYAYKPANNFKGYILIDKGEAGIDDSEVIQKAIDYVNILGGGLVKLNGKFSISLPLKLYNNISVEGMGSGYTTELKATTTIDSILDLTEARRNTIRYLYINGNFKATKCINLHATTSRSANIHIERCWIKNANILVDASNCEDTELRHCVLADFTQYGIYIEECGGQFSIDRTLITHNSAQGEASIYIKEGELEIVKCALEGSKTYDPTDALIKAEGLATFVKVSHTWLISEKCPNVVASADLASFELHGCRLGLTNNSTLEANINTIDSGNFRRLTICGGYLYNLGGGNYTISGSASHVFVIGATVNKGFNTTNIKRLLDARAGLNTIIYRGYGKLYENSGTATFSGDGSTTQFKIAHGLVSTPDKGKTRVWALSPDAADNFWIDVDDTYIYVNYKTAPPSGTDNVVLGWYAEV